MRFKKNLPEEQPAGDQTFIGLTWGLLHDVQIWWIETKSGSWETISNLRELRTLDITAASS